MAVALDTNILLRMSQSHTPEYPVISAALATLKAQGETFVCFVQNMAEFWSVATRPATSRGGFGLSAWDALALMATLEAGVVVLPDPPSLYADWKGLLTSPGVLGVQAHDARLAAAMIGHKVEKLLTLNAGDFARYTMIEAVLPADVK